ncbi:unnamed protein product [Coffea canephora]|uniref:Sieve element occlusion N-terminal domain-containing protein n=1 Tax=Coffea canephora TaxID=49390 RepID=A0A068V5D8_COFCA|nr:unnamed protein product [Coffea canephora]
MFSASYDTAILKQIEKTHDPESRELEIRPILHIIEAILQHISLSIDGVTSGTPHGDADASEEITVLAGTEGTLDGFTYKVQKVCSLCLVYKFSVGASTVAILNMLCSHSWVQG